VDKYLNTIIHGDCLKVMSELPKDCVDMILCDLPYGVTARNKWDVVIPFEPLWEQYTRVAKQNAAVVLTATQPFASQLIVSNPKLFRYDLIWEKNKKTGFLNAKKMPLRAHECILVFYRSLPIYNPQKTTGHKPVNSYTKHTSDGLNYGETKRGISGGGQTDRYPISVLRFPVVNNDSEDKFHSTQKPVELFEYLIRTYTDERMVVLDNCIGSGTTAIAALKTNRQYIGIEIEEEYCRITKDRINKVLRDTDESGAT
jgi:site-specific DNA-methyltransferase (adenine-specific)